jgi:hypothetical protein
MLPRVRGLSGAAIMALVDCRIDVLAVEPVHGRGRWVAQAHVRLTIADVPLVLQGFRLIKEPGSVKCEWPSYRDPGTGTSTDCVTAPPELALAIGREVLSAFTGQEPPRIRVGCEGPA